MGCLVGVTAGLNPCHSFSVIGLGRVKRHKPQAKKHPRPEMKGRLTVGAGCRWGGGIEGVGAVVRWLLGLEVHLLGGDS